MGNKLRLIVTSYSNSLHTRKLKDKETGAPVEGLRQFSDFFLQHQQHGIGVQGGLEAMIHSIQLHTELEPHKGRARPWNSSFHALWPWISEALVAAT